MFAPEALTTALEAAVPPDSHDGRHNRSPRREALVALVDEARAREAKAS